MLDIKGHGGNIAPDTAETDTRYGTVSSVCGFVERYYPEWETADFGTFGYFFPEAPDSVGGEAATEALVNLGKAMAEDPALESDNANIPPIFTYLGQFIDHDITAGTDREEGVSKIDEVVIDALPREDAVANIANLRAGALNLDSLYGGGPVQGDFAELFDTALRFPGDRSKLWAGTMSSVPGQRLDLPRDPAGDLLRLGRVVAQSIPGLTEADLRALPENMRKNFFTDDGDGDLIVQKAVIGDGRNDENLFVAQLHLAFVRLHNQIVDSAHLHDGPVSDKDALFEWARRQVQFTYQWLVLNVFLPTVCDPEIVTEIINDGATLYSDFFNQADTPHMRMPFEFSVAAFRYGHSMVRASYDWNKFFGRPEAGSANNLTEADFTLLFAFTGNGQNPMFGQPRLPSNWGADWSRLAISNPEFPDRSTRKIDSKVALPLSTMTNEGEGQHQPMQHLMLRNLLRGLRLNLPSAQDCIASLEAKTGKAIPRLSAENLLSGKTAEAICNGGFVYNTPLWFYILKEAEIQADGKHLGALGSHIVAETLVGLVQNDVNSYWNAEGSDCGRWHPRDGAQPRGEAITDMPALLRAALLL